MFERNKWKEILVLALPVVVSKLSFTAMGIVDTAMVGHLGATEQAAAGFAVVYLFTLYVFGLGVITSVNTLVSQYYGAGQKQKCGVVLANGLVLALAIGLLTWGALLVSKPVFALMGMNRNICDQGYEYLFFRGFGLLGVFGYWVYNSFSEGLGRTRTPMVVTIVANVINIVLDYILIFGYGPVPAMGLKGAGIATAASNTFMFVTLVYLVHRKRGTFVEFGIVHLFKKIRVSVMRKMLNLGLPMGFQMFLEVGAFLIFTTLVGWTGDAQLAASQIAMRIMSVSFMTSWGISIAATTLVGRAQGENRSDLAVAAMKRAMVLITIITFSLGVLTVSIPATLVSFFTPFPEVSSIAVKLLFAAAVFALLDGFNMVGYGTLRGAGDTVWPLWLVAFMHWVVGIPLVYYLTIPAGYGAVGNWVGMAIMMVVQALFMVYRVKSGKWKDFRLVESGA